MTKKNLLYTLAAIVCAFLSAGPLMAADQKVANAFVIYDSDVVQPTMTYCKLTGIGGDPFRGPIAGSGLVKTTGVSATIDSNTAASGALTNAVAGDVIMFRKPPSDTTLTRVVISKASNDQVTVESTVDLSAGSYLYTVFHSSCGTDNTAGWIDTGEASRIMLTMQYEQGDLGALRWHFQCKQNSFGSMPVTVYPSEGDGCGNAGAQTATGFCDFTTAGATARFTFEEFGSWGSCRIGVAYFTSDASDVGAAMEQITAGIVVSKGGGL